MIPLRIIQTYPYIKLIRGVIYVKTDVNKKKSYNNITETYHRENTIIHIVKPDGVEDEYIDRIMKEYQDIAWRIIEKGKKNK